jgi:hypothetical protein
MNAMRKTADSTLETLSLGHNCSSMLAAMFVFNFWSEKLF